MTETTNPQAEGQEASILDQDLTQEGRYIPYSGGSMGWFENSGVLKSELGNNYLFHTVMQSDEVRSKQFERWGDSFNRRGRKKRVRKETGVTLISGSGEIRGSTRDISINGVRLQFLEELGIAKGDLCTLRIHEGDTDIVLTDLGSKVVWLERIGKIRPVWNLGLTFPNITPEQTEILRPLLAED